MCVNNFAKFDLIYFFPYVRVEVNVNIKRVESSPRRTLKFALMYLIRNFFHQVLLLSAEAGDMMRKSIVYDKNTPDVFYCPQQKPTGFEKMIVNAKPLSRLCQFEGKSVPPDYKSDCYNDVDETEYACKEKYRIMVSHR